jgi:hypothetical protein
MPTLVLIWVWFCAYLNCAGWVLSAIHQLNAGGYAAALAFWFVALFIWKQKTSGRIFPRACRQKFRRRFRKPFPLAFLILAAMAFLGGAIYAPTNYDALAYRLPRVLHWLAADQWHWIHTIFPRVNARGCGIEWVSAPFIALLKTDRLLFLINIVSFLFLPGLIFSVFTRLGVRRRVAWHWMWILPTGYCFLLQAGSIGNDLFTAPFALAALDFALRAKISRSPRDFFASVLAAALLTGVKMTDPPLLLPWAIAILPSLKLCLRWPARTFLVGMLALSASIVPTAFFNAQHYHGDWTGMSPENAGMKKNPAILTVQNTVLCVVQNFSPPLFPFGKSWDGFVHKVMPGWWHERLMGMMEPGGVNLHIDEVQIEEGAGLGFGVSALLLASVVAVAGKSRRMPVVQNPKSREALWLAAVRLSPWAALLVLFTQANATTLGRTIAPYYALLIPILLLHPAHEKLAARCWWRAAAFAVFVMAAGLLVVSPARPLFPVGTFLEKIRGASSPALGRVREVYSVYHERNDAFAPVRDALPPDIRILGAITFDDPETSLWHPFGTRRVEHVTPQDTAADLKARGVEYILVKPDAFGKWFDGTPDGWFKRMNATVVQKIPLNLRAADGVRDWYLVKLN